MTGDDLDGAWRTGHYADLEEDLEVARGDPYAWFKDVLTRIAAHPINRLAELLPHNWKLAQA